MAYKPDYTTHNNSEAHREELGHDRLFLRPPQPAAKTLDSLATKLGTNRSRAVAYAIAKTLKEVERMSEADLRAAIRFMEKL